MPFRTRQRGGAIQRRREAVTQIVNRNGTDVFVTVDRVLPETNEPRHIVVARRREVRRREREAVPFGRGVPDRNAVHVGEPRQQPSIQQRQRGALLAAVPQGARRGADVRRQAGRPEIEIAHVRGRGQRFVLFSRQACPGRRLEHVSRREHRQNRCTHPDGYRPDCPSHANKPAIPASHPILSARAGWRRSRQRRVFIVFSALS